MKKYNGDLVWLVAVCVLIAIVLIWAVVIAKIV
jgi:hypothetical protein